MWTCVTKYSIRKQTVLAKRFKIYYKLLSYNFSNSSQENKTDIFISDNLTKRMNELRTRCDQLDVMNTNIATSLNKSDTQDKTPNNLSKYNT